MMNARKPNQSNRGWSAVVTLFSGVSLSRKALTAATAIDIRKIHRHPREDATRPPKSAQSPEPPQEPMDQKLTARCRSLPSKESFSRASVAGMMHAAESPWIIRPVIRKNAVPVGERAISSEPRALKARPT